MEVTKDKVARWAQEIGAPGLRLAELDLRLTDVLSRICSDEYLRDVLAFKGGTAISKLYLRSQGRLSVDLDFNVLGTRDSVQRDRGELRSRLVSILKAHDATMLVRHSHSWEGLHLVARYSPVTGAGKEKLKVELSMIERFPLTKIVRQRIAVPEGASADVPSYPIEELLATKFRALFARRKGRDLFDLDLGRPLLTDPALMRRMAVYYFFRSAIIYDPMLLKTNIDEKLSDRRFLDDS